MGHSGRVGVEVIKPMGNFFSDYEVKPGWLSKNKWLILFALVYVGALYHDITHVPVSTKTPQQLGGPKK